VSNFEEAEYLPSINIDTFYQALKYTIISQPFSLLIVMKRLAGIFEFLKLIGSYNSYLKPKEKNQDQG
jgi:hypothetical protein